MFHINDKQEAKPCRAKVPQNCKFYNGENDSRHYETVIEATEASQKSLEAEFGKTPKTTTYSFLKKFREIEKQFNHDFEGVPKRFFNADLRGKNFSRLNDIKNLRDKMIIKFALELEGKEKIHVPGDYFNPQKVYGRLAQSMSSPKDNQLPSDDVIKLTKEMGIEEIEELPGRSVNSNRAWKGKIGDRQIVITDERIGEDFAKYRFRIKPNGFTTSFFHPITVRALVGTSRIKRKTEMNLIEPIVKKHSAKEKYLTKIATLDTLMKLEEAQLEGRSFIAQQKHVKDHSGKIATAWMDKKNPDKVHQDLMNNHGLGKYFRHVEIDNDVDPKEFHAFQESIKEIESKLPEIPNNLKPELRIRKLGKHRANGIYFPHKNTVCVDVRTSEAFIHEMGHYYDLAVKDNASLSEDFRSITREYSENVKTPDPSKKEYYCTPTEIFARGFELYSHKKLGIDNRLLRADRFDRFDYEPFTKNPELEAEVFKIFDNLFKK